MQHNNMADPAHDARVVDFPSGLALPTQALASGFVGARAPRAAAKSAAEQARQGFRIGELCLMLRYQDGSELAEMPTVFRLPNTPDWLRGMANLHGALIPVFDLAALIGTQPDADAKRMLLVLSHGAHAAGVVIDGLPERLRWAGEPTGGAEMAPARIASAVKQAVFIDGRLRFDIDCESLLQLLESLLESAS